MQSEVEPASPSTVCFNLDDRQRDVAMVGRRVFDSGKRWKCRNCGDPAIRRFSAISAFPLVDGCGFTNSPTADSQQPTIKTFNPRMFGLTLTTFTFSITIHRLASCLQKCLEKRTTHQPPASTLTRYADRCSGRYLLSA